MVSRPDGNWMIGLKLRGKLVRLTEAFRQATSGRENPPHVSELKSGSPRLPSRRTNSGELFEQLKGTTVSPGFRTPEAPTNTL